MTMLTWLTLFWVLLYSILFYPTLLYSILFYPAPFCCRLLKVGLSAPPLKGKESTIRILNSPKQPQIFKLIVKTWESKQLDYLYRAVWFWVAGRPACCSLLPPRRPPPRSAWPCRRRRRPPGRDRGRGLAGRKSSGCCSARSAGRSAPGRWSGSGSGWGRSWRWAGRGRTGGPCPPAPAGGRRPAPRNRRKPEERGDKRTIPWENVTKKTTEKTLKTDGY